MLSFNGMSLAIVAGLQVGLAAAAIDWANAQAQAQEMVSSLTLDEKIALTYGNSSAGLCIGVIPPIPRLNFSGLCMSDGPSAVNRHDYITVFPSGITAAASWDKELIYQRGLALGAEARGKGVNVLLGPSTGPIGRHALGGRNWEGFGADPYLAGVAMSATIRGIQENGVQTCSKHYAANEQETQRSNSTSPDGDPVDAISSNVDDRTMHELYLWPFADAVKAGTTSIMCAYNRFNQTYACENSYLLTEVLREQLGFKGYVVSDWFATHSAAKAANAGLDMEMPGQLPQSGSGFSFFFGDGIPDALENGSLPEERLNEMALRILTPYFAVHQDSPDFPTPDPSGAFMLAASEFGLLGLIESGFFPPDAEFPRGRDVRADHATIVREVAAAGTVLLKNNQTLPLKSPKVIGVFGDDSTKSADGFLPQYFPQTETNSQIGSLFIGGGSGTGRPISVVAPIDAIGEKAQEIGAEVQYIANNARLASGNFKGIYPIPDICLVFQKSYASEGYDRISFELDNNSTAVIENVVKLCDNVVVVTHSGGVNTMPWADEPKIGAIIAAHYPGEQSGNSIVDVLWGNINPSGRLPYTIPMKAEDAGPPVVNLTGPVETAVWQSNFTDGQLIDYRHYDSFNITPRYEFGFGLSYTTFELVNGSVSASLINGTPLEADLDPSIPIDIGGHPALWENIIVVSAQVSNVGGVAGFAVPQLYVSFPSSAPSGTPVKVLRGFEKVYVEPRASRTVEFFLTRRDVSYWDEVGKTWIIPIGSFRLAVGFSSRDLRGEARLEVAQ